jgi:hypothetical protein
MGFLLTSEIVIQEMSLKISRMLREWFLGAVEQKKNSTMKKRGNFTGLALLPIAIPIVHIRKGPVSVVVHIWGGTKGRA